MQHAFYVPIFVFGASLVNLAAAHTSLLIAGEGTVAFVGFKLGESNDKDLRVGVTLDKPNGLNNGMYNMCEIEFLCRITRLHLICDVCLVYFCPSFLLHPL